MSATAHALLTSTTEEVVVGALVAGFVGFLTWYSRFLVSERDERRKITVALIGDEGDEYNPDGRPGALHDIKALKESHIAQERQRLADLKDWDERIDKVLISLEAGGERFMEHDRKFDVVFGHLGLDTGA